MEGGTMSSSAESFTAVLVQEEGAPLIPFGAGYTAPPPTPSASCPPLHGVLLARLPTHSNSATDGDDDDDDKFSVPSMSNSTASPPSKQDLDALAQYLLQQSLHLAPCLVTSPSTSLQQRRRTRPAHVVIHPNTQEDDHVVNSRNDIKIEEVVQTFTYAGGFCVESRRGIVKACQEVGAFRIRVPDTGEALSMLNSRHGTDEESIIQGRLVTLSQLLNGTSACHLHDDLAMDSFSFDSGMDATFRDVITRFASLLSQISKDVLRIVLENLQIETQANIRDHTLKPLLHIHGTGKQELKFENETVLFISHTCESKSSALFLARLGPWLQTWSQGKYKNAIGEALYNDGVGEISIQFALV